MQPIAIPDWVAIDPGVRGVRPFHLPPGSGVSGPPAAAYLVDVQAENAIRPMPMWHVLLETSDEEISILQRSHLLVMAVSVVPIFQVYPAPFTVDGAFVSGETL